MTYFDVFVGELSDGGDPLDWGGDWNGNTPKEGGPVFPPLVYGEPFWQLRKAIDQGLLPGKQVDWGAWAAIVSKEYISKFIEQLYRGQKCYEGPNVMPHLYAQLDRVREYVQSLSEDRQYALVACEF